MSGRRLSQISSNLLRGLPAVPAVVSPDATNFGNNQYGNFVNSDSELSGEVVFEEDATSIGSPVIVDYKEETKEEGKGKGKDAVDNKPDPPDKIEEELSLELLTTDKDYDSETMPTSLPAKGTLKIMLGGIMPNHNPNTINLQTFYRDVANKLAGVPFAWALGGMVWLVEDQEAYNLRTGSTKTLLEYLELPKQKKTPTVIEYKIYEEDRNKYEQSWFWNGKAINALDKKFPWQMIGLEVPS